ncbi:alpha/beta hydrolase [Lacticaseibacillus casei]|uniref:Alpha/beta hydrolase n=1 Tax=Lacticaseibacillus zeae TaxID=57037 RepID=A0A5R8LXD6_LACZE|nr:alpha/beta hydrolase [Lacticaseibacillus zeae]OLS10876.1 alpha/beta hydrolase [Lacticaseibacillus casei]QVI31237.1 alpha/beta hydrolase [Lacticaseibacillus zeae]TLF42007.1 alpha/beta hydrolase [Lacticaseibacillus zeae]
MTQPILEHDSVAFQAARNAENQLWADFNLKPKARWFKLPPDELRVRVLEFGHGDPVLIVPGNTGDPYPFAPLLPQLAGYHLFVLARPGGGLSDGFDHEQVDVHQFAVDLIGQIMDKLDLKSAPIIAHSMGAHWATWFALAHPERVDQLILLGNPGRMLMTKTPGMLKMAMMPGLGQWFMKRQIPKSAKRAWGPLHRMGTDPVAVSKLPQSFAACVYAFDHLPNYAVSTLSLLRSMNSEKNHNGLGEDQLRHLSVPTTLIWGTNDALARPELGQEIAAVVQHGELVTINGAGHEPWIDDPEKVGTIIRLKLKDSRLRAELSRL